MAYAARPVPQNIMSVEFKFFDLVTVKQFLWSSGVIVVTVILFWVLPSQWKLIVSVLFVLISAIIIFVPFNGEPFLTFLSSFLEAFISPQRRIWNRKGVVVKSAYSAAKKYQYGADYEENLSSLMLDTNIHKTQEQELLDKQEGQFLGQKISENGVERRSISEIKKTTDTSPDSLHKATHVRIAVNHYDPSQKQYPASPVPIQSKLDDNKKVFESVPAQKNVEVTTLESNLKAELPSEQYIQTQTVNIQQTISELQELVAPKSEKIENDELVIKNYIFGTVENEHEEPVREAAVIIMQGNTNLEVIYTGESGEFKTGFEYKAGEYRIHVNVGSRVFNEITIQHDPIDTVAVIIQPIKKVAEFTNIQPEKVEKQTLEPDIFDGAYDSTAFTAYDEEVEIEVPLKEEPTLEVIDTSTVIPIEQPKVNISSVPVQNVTINNTASQPIINFNALPVSAGTFNTSYVNLPNTLNGEIMQNYKGIQGIHIIITDDKGSIVRSVASDSEGKFYTFSSLSFGTYFITFKKDSYTFLTCWIKLDGGIIKPRVIEIQ